MAELEALETHWLEAPRGQVVEVRRLDVMTDTLPRGELDLVRAHAPAEALDIEEDQP